MKTKISVETKEYISTIGTYELSNNDLVELREHAERLAKKREILSH